MSIFKNLYLQSIKMYIQYKKINIIDSDIV